MKDCCRSFIFNYNIVFQLIIKISISEAFTKSCNVSLQTVQFVSKCPTNLSSYEAATRNKNCSSLSEEAQGCFPLQYHCVLSEDLEHAIEVCALSLNIIDHVCAKFSTDLKSVMRVEGLNCSKCPYSYNSTLAYKYSECYSNLTQPLKTTLAQSTTQTNNGTDVTKDPDSYVDSTSGGNTADTVSLFVGVPLGIICLAALIFFLVKKCRNVAGQSQKNEGYASVPPSEPGGAEYHMQRDDEDEHAHISQFEAGEIELTIPNVNTVVTRETEPGRAEYHMQRDDDDEHAHISQFVSDGGQQSGEHVLTSQSEAGEIELTSPNVNTVVTRETVADIAQLPSPYENNVTASLPEPGGAEYHMQRDDDDEHAHISQFEAGEIESTIPNVNTVVTRETEPGGAEYHMQRDDDDEHAHISQFEAGEIESTIPNVNTVVTRETEPGGAEYHMQRDDDDEHAHISQFEAGEIESTIPNVNTVVTRETEPGGAEYHMQRDDDDEHAHISQFEAGEIESTIPNVNTVVTRETVADIAQLTSPYENNVTASLPVSTIEENQKLENLRAKLDSFKSSRQSKYPAYTKYNTRLLSFAKELPWSDDKRKQFSAYGFLYGGYDLKTICFHCGCNKDDWRETDDILETHLSLSEPCAYVQFVNVLLNSSQ